MERRHPACDVDDAVTWRPREWIRQADFVVNQAMDSDSEKVWKDPDVLLHARRGNVLLFSDGGFRRKSMRAAAGWVAFAVSAGKCQLIAYEARPLANTASAFATEAIALEMALKWLTELD